MSRRRPAPTLLYLLTLLCAAIITACGVDTTSPTPEPPTPTPIVAATVLSSATDSMAQLESYRWESEYNAGGNGDAAPFYAEFEGVWANGDLDYTATFYVNGGATVQRHRYVDGRAFRLDRGTWKEQPLIDPTGVPAWDDRSPIPHLDQATVELDTDGNWHIQGTRSVTHQDSGWTVDYTVTALIRDTDKRVLRTAIDTVASNGDTSRTITRYHDFNGPLPIDLP